MSKPLQLKKIVASIVLAYSPFVFSIDHNELPTNPKIESGDINIQIDAPKAEMNINQSTQTGIINWNTFNVGSSATVNFNQPNSSASTLNRITGANASQIYGKINAPGSVILVNESGVYFSPTSSVDVGSIAVSAQNITNENYLKGNYEFNEGAQSGGQIINEGQIVAHKDYIAMLAPEIRNQGIITAQKGTVVLASGEKISLHFTDNNLTSVTTTPSLYKALIDNRYLVDKHHSRHC